MLYCIAAFILYLVAISFQRQLFLSQEECESQCTSAGQECKATGNIPAWQCITGMVKRDTDWGRLKTKRCIRVDACASEPCESGGTCRRICNTPGYLCECVTPYFGQNCGQVDPCALNPCQNGGTCSAAGVNFNCTCTPAFTGPTCSDPADPCSPHPCLNGGTCVPFNTTAFICQCPLVFPPYIDLICNETLDLPPG